MSRGGGGRRCFSGETIPPPILVWLTSLLLVFFFFRLALHNSAVSPRRDPPLMSRPDEDNYVSYGDQRSQLYDKMARDLEESRGDKGTRRGGEQEQHNEIVMARDLEEKGLAFLSGGQTSQSLSLSDIFSLKDGLFTPAYKV